ncbi:MAG TPA: hypothetical protein VIX37_23865 [Candidatus Sulfotelmatobacter sp.]
MTFSFILLLPFAMGFITIYAIERHRAQPVWMWFLFPWVTIAAAEVAMMAVLWEGMICIVMFTPIALTASTLGGVAAGLIMSCVSTVRALRKARRWLVSYACPCC